MIPQHPVVDEDVPPRSYPQTYRKRSSKERPNINKRLSKSAQVPDYLAETPIDLLPNDLKENLRNQERFAQS